MIGGIFAERLHVRYSQNPAPTVSVRARRGYRVLAVLCFTAIFVTATEPVVPVTSDNLVAALEKITAGQVSTTAAWR